MPDHTDTEVITIASNQRGREGYGDPRGRSRGRDIELTATLTDPDGGCIRRGMAMGQVFIQERGIHRHPRCEPGNLQAGNDDTGMYLRATVTYTDGHAGRGQERLCHLEQQDAVEGIRSAPIPGPRTARHSDTTTREVNENAGAGTNVGAPVAATDIGDRGRPENLTYALRRHCRSGDANSFDIDQSTGQIKVKRGIDLDQSDRD